MSEILVIDTKYEPLEEIPWSLEAAQRFKLTADEISDLRNDKVIWRGDVALSLEEQ